MVRAGVVNHPSEWPDSGYHEIQSPRRKCAVIAYQKLAEKAGFQSYEAFKKAHAEWLSEALGNNRVERQGEWTESIAVGSERYTATIKEKLGIRAKGRTIRASRDGAYQLREPMPDYNDDFTLKKKHIGAQNSHLWNIYHDIPN